MTLFSLHATVLVAACIHSHFVAAFVPDAQKNRQSPVRVSFYPAQRQQSLFLVKSSKPSASKAGTNQNSNKQKKNRTWDQSFELLKEFKRKHGHCKIPKDYKEDPKLGGWAHLQRRRKDNLSKEKHDKLLDIGFDLTPDRMRSFEETFQRLLQYKETHGDYNVPHHYKDDPQLALWVRNYRWKQGKIAEEKKEMLDQIGFVWSGAYEIKRERAWNEMFARLEEYKAIHGDCLVPTRWKQNKNLGGWVGRQRKLYRDGKLPENRVSKLESIDFVWRLQPYNPRSSIIWEAQWFDQYQKVIAFKEKEGHTRIPVRFPEDESLGDWVRTQRELNRDKLLRPDRLKLLEDIEFCWSFEEELNVTWNEKYKALSLFLKQSPLRDLPKHSYSLYKWLSHQSYSYAKGSLDPDRKSRLDDLGVDWENYP